MSLPLARVFQCLFTFMLVSASCWLAGIWQLSQQGAKGELEVEFKFQRRDVVVSSPSFSLPAARVPRRAYLQASKITGMFSCLVCIHKRWYTIKSLLKAPPPAPPPQVWACLGPPTRRAMSRCKYICLVLKLPLDISIQNTLSTWG